MIMPKKILKSFRLPATLLQRLEDLRKYVGEHKLRPAKEQASITDVVEVALEIGLGVLDRHRAADEAGR